MRSARIVPCSPGGGCGGGRPAEGDGRPEEGDGDTEEPGDGEVLAVGDGEAGPGVGDGEAGPGVGDGVGCTLGDILDGVGVGGAAGWSNTGACRNNVVMTACCGATAHSADVESKTSSSAGSTAQSGGRRITTHGSERSCAIEQRAGDRTVVVAWQVLEKSGSLRATMALV